MLSIHEQVSLVLGVDSEIQSLTDTLRSVRDVLEDAERRQVKEKAVKGWLERLKDMAYQMDDVVDEWSTAILQLQIKGAESASMSKKNLSEERLQRLITTSVIDTSEVYGRDMDKNTILGHLLGETCQETESGPHIISIVGTGGMGKTTLAQLAYNLPENFREIVEILQGESPNLHSLEALQQKIQTCIAGKKFLIVLDDVWTENHQLWGQLKSTLNCGGVGSRILATTRKESVVKMVGTTYTHSLEELSREQARALFHQIAFFEKSREKVEELKEIGENIADKCKGLPLAIKTLGNLMRSKHNREEWENVLCSEVWQLDEFERDISPALLLSYHDLPPAIQRCFSFCAVFPKDSVIERDELIKLWMAQSYLKSDGSKEMEMVGRTYFEYLAARSFFQDFKKDTDGNIIGCKMHDIVHDFAQFLTQNECFIVEVDNQQMESVNLSFKKIRHTTLVVRESTPNFVSTYNMKNLRTLLAQRAFNSRVLEALGHLTCLRALDLSSNELIEELPKESRKLPQAMGKLINLRHLENESVDNLKGDLRNLNNLRGDLSIQGLDEVKDAGEAEKAELKNKVHIQRLELNFGGEKGTKGVAEALQPHPNLKSLYMGLLW
ncbi:putative disease resistance protein RGA3 [Vitis vinifera]|uniref:Putative disease resistance protein RGA3 n=1 Tax=Vitis vinifera TaxID=29760 RepID=A0A438FGN1_VITVI|nr:putative disease resistance protein RGA3 [Vitis vinifera]